MADARAGQCMLRAVERRDHRMQLAVVRGVARQDDRAVPAPAQLGGHGGADLPAAAQHSNRHRRHTPLTTQPPGT